MVAMVQVVEVEEGVQVFSESFIASYSALGGNGGIGNSGEDGSDGRNWAGTLPSEVEESANTIVSGHGGGGEAGGTAENHTVLSSDIDFIIRGGRGGEGGMGGNINGGGEGGENSNGYTENGRSNRGIIGQGGTQYVNGEDGSYGYIGENIGEQQFTIVENSILVINIGSPGESSNPGLGGQGARRREDGVTHSRLENGDDGTGGSAGMDVGQIRIRTDIV